MHFPLVSDCPSFTICYVSKMSQIVPSTMSKKKKKSRKQNYLTIQPGCDLAIVFNTLLHLPKLSGLSTSLTIALDKKSQQHVHAHSFPLPFLVGDTCEILREVWPPSWHQIQEVVPKMTLPSSTIYVLQVSMSHSVLIAHKRNSGDIAGGCIHR